MPRTSMGPGVLNARPLVHHGLGVRGPLFAVEPPLARKLAELPSRVDITQGPCRAR